MSTKTEEAVASKDAIELLKEDHEKVKELFEQFEEAEDSATKQQVVETVIQELQVHTSIEEEIFYPAAKEKIEEQELLDEAEEEHHVVDLLIEELQDMKPSEEHFDAKFSVLMENVKHHIKEEEGEMFPQAKSAGLDLAELGQRMAQRKLELQEEGASGQKSKSRASKGSKKKKH